MIAFDVESNEYLSVTVEEGKLLREPTDERPQGTIARPHGSVGHIAGSTERSIGSSDGSTRHYLSRGWFDIQVNGFAGYDINTGEMRVDDFEEMVRKLRAEGVTRFLPTVITNSIEHMRSCLASIVEARQQSPLVEAAIPGIHLEGPFISPDRGARGAHSLEHIRDADPVLFGDLQRAANGLIRLVTLAPEVPGAVDLIRELSEKEVVVAIGHSIANAEDIQAAVEAGSKLSTHLGNGVPAHLPRHPNLIWEQLAQDGLMASAIFDGHHLPDSFMRTMYRAKGPERLILTSDAVSLARQEPGIYEGQVGGKVELHENGRLNVYGSEYLAGSASSLLDGVRTALRLGIEPGAALRLVTVNPSHLLGLEVQDEWVLVEVGSEGARLEAVAVDGKVN